MKDALEQLAEETIEELLKSLPLEVLVKGLSADEILAALSPKMREELAQRLKEDDSLPNPDIIVPEHGGSEQ